MPEFWKSLVGDTSDAAGMLRWIILTAARYNEADNLDPAAEVKGDPHAWCRVAVVVSGWITKTFCASSCIRMMRGPAIDLKLPKPNSRISLIKRDGNRSAGAIGSGVDEDAAVFGHGMSPRMASAP
jgi:hypothetical protein